MQYTPHYNLNLPEGSDIVNPLIQDNPNYTAIDTAMYNNKLRVVGTATHVKAGTNHSITLGDSDINQFKFVATGDYASGDTFTVDGVTVTARIADGSSIPSGAFKINSTVLCILDGTILNLINVDGIKPASDITYDNTSSGLPATTAQGAIDAAVMRVELANISGLNVPDNTAYIINTITSDNTTSFKSLQIFVLTSDGTPYWKQIDLPLIGSYVNDTKILAALFVAGVYYGLQLDVNLSPSGLSITYNLTTYTNRHITNVIVYGVR